MEYFIFCCPLYYELREVCMIVSKQRPKKLKKSHGSTTLWLSTFGNKAWFGAHHLLLETFFSLVSQLHRVRGYADSMTSCDRYLYVA
jgi:hypothetical protein